MGRKLLLIHPGTIGKATGYGETKAWGMPPLGLGYVASLTPRDWSVRIIDEHVDDLDYTEGCDLVGLTSYSLNAPRAYQIAAEFRRRNIPTVIGGIHVSMVPDEAVRYVDSVVIGEAESVWAEVISDFEKGRLKKKYFAKRLPLTNLPTPRRDLFSAKYEMDIIQTTRGCPFRCEFCSVSAFNGAEYRQRPVSEVLDELGVVKKKLVYFVDDNILGFGKDAEERALELFKGMIERKLNKIWGTQASINLAYNDTLLKYAHKSGLRMVYIGFESLVSDSLREMRKGINIKAGVDGYKKAIKRLHDNGIGVVGAFIIGNDGDDVSSFKELKEFMSVVNLDVLSLACLTPLPGTELFERLKKEGRIIYDDYPRDWERYDTDHVVIKPKKMSVDDMVLGYKHLAEARFGRVSNVINGARTLLNTRDIVTALFAYSLNRSTWEFIVRDRNLDRI